MGSRSVAEAFETFVRRLTPTETQRNAGAGHRASVKAALEARLDVRNFFETGSFSHGTGVRNYSDIDALVSLGNKPDSSYTALTRVRDALLHRFPNTPISIDRPAVRVKFAGGYETWEIIPGFMSLRGTASQLVYDIPGPAAGSAYIDSAPKEHLKYVNECNTAPGKKGAAKELARLIKAWKYYRSVPISSFYLEMRCAQHVASVSSYIAVWDVSLVLSKLVGHSLAAMNDPKRAAGLIHACSSDAARIDALSKLSTASARADRALSAYRADRTNDCFEALDLLFAGHFPSRYF